MVDKCFKITGKIADRRQIPPARILNDLFDGADALNTMRVNFGQSENIGYDGSWIFGIWNPVCCGQGYNHIGDWSLGLKQSSINAWWEGFNGGWKCGDYGVEGNELFFNTPAREIGQYYLNCNGWEYWVDEDYHITDEGFFAPIHPVDITRIYVGGSLGASYETFGDAGTILMAKIHWFDLNSLRRLPANTVITR
ncbi:hypothetical protein J7M23_09560, partial [Candidatus Sumerlaeota bacterium]|nr:hypothetical protein [Candidatus Sumerlaeota bacterium]